MFEAGKEYKLRSGGRARVYATDGMLPMRIHGAMLEDAGWESSTWSEDGRFLKDGPSPLDLMPSWASFQDSVNQIVNQYPTCPPGGQKQETE